MTLTITMIYIRKEIKLNLFWSRHSSSKCLVLSITVTQPLKQLQILVEFNNSGMYFVLSVTDIPTKVTKYSIEIKPFQTINLVGDIENSFGITREKTKQQNNIRVK